MPAEPRTRVLQAADGGQEWRLSRCDLTVRKGPDRGRTLELERGQVSVGTSEACSLRLSDPTVSRLQFEVVIDPRGFLLRDLGSTNGTRVEGVRVREVWLDHGSTIRAGATELRFSAREEERSLPLSREHRFGELLGKSHAMRSLFAMLERAAPTSATVLIEGESGTGKELVARELHRASSRADGPLVVVDGGSIPENLIESELFGHEKGAFTGADRARAGAFEEANGGTIFLDEIGELPLEMQSKLLRALENREIKRLGSQTRLGVDVRVVAATNRSLDEEVKAGRFRSDLFYRLAVCRLWVPPLRQRPEDVELLARHLVARSGGGRNPEELLTPSLLAALTSYTWPGNVRELRNVVDRLIVFPELPPEQVIRGTPPATTATAAATTGAWRSALAELPFHEARRAVMDEFEQRYFSEMLARHEGVVAHAAAKAEIPRQSFHRILRRLGLRGE